MTPTTRRRRARTNLALLAAALAVGVAVWTLAVYGALALVT